MCAFDSPRPFRWRSAAHPPDGSATESVQTHQASCAVSSPVQSAALLPPPSITSVPRPLLSVGRSIPREGSTSAAGAPVHFTGLVTLVSHRGEAAAVLMGAGTHLPYLSGTGARPELLEGLAGGQAADNACVHIRAAPPRPSPAHAARGRMGRGGRPRRRSKAAGSRRLLRRQGDASGHGPPQASNLLMWLPSLCHLVWCNG